jgi:hypothetical protein
MAALPAPAPEPPADSEAGSDAGWFDEHPKRRYRMRPGWAVRRVGGVCLRTEIPTMPAEDSESAAERAWWAAAWPQLDEKTRDKVMRKARRRAR